MSLTRCATFLPFLTTHCFVLLLILPTFPPFVCPISFRITRFNAGATDMLYEGDATPSLGTIELNKVDRWDRAGRASYFKPLHLWDSATGNLTDFTTRFSFTIDLQGSFDTQGSDGLAFYLAPVGYQIPPNSAAENLGLFNSTTRGGVPGNQIVLVEFDTWQNPEFDPPVGKHIGINNNSLSSLAYASWNLDYNKTQNVLITYNSTTKNLSLLWSDMYVSNFNFTGNTTSLSQNINLMEALPEWVQIGFSASSGYGEWHTIHSWEFSSTLDSELVSGSSKKQKKTPLVVIVVVVCSFLLVALGVSLSYCFVTKRKSKKIGNRGDYGKFDLEREALPKRFHYQELLAATNGFANDRRLGQGGSGQVYKGILIDLGRLVAVKRISAESENSERIFMNEAKIISRLIHRNLVQFIGWCHEKDELLLVDIKSANVLLDIDFSPKLGDFGIAKLVDPRLGDFGIAKLVDPRLKTQTTGVVGTFGYLAPEYLNHGRATKESDMFSFGVVALEIACGRRTYLDSEGHHVPLVKWVWEHYVAGDILTAADERLNRDFVKSEMICLLIVGLWCTNPIDNERPKAGQVMKVLQLEAPLPELQAPLLELQHEMHDYKQALANSIQSAPITTSLDNGGR
ncbi:Lectin-like receptor kinase [Quillaja saponaria]|uniref:Lectin-like receptor kinase n=1 Tax=Quillaja saponaria TaxID=32244 RepID=A0AAD7PSX8_QUISA|nr:Lectin-like receptor kinase [Quillaja saponaria]